MLYISTKRALFPFARFRIMANARKSMAQLTAARNGNQRNYAISNFIYAVSEITKCFTRVLGSVPWFPALRPREGCAFPYALERMTFDFVRSGDVKPNNA